LLTPDQKHQRTASSVEIVDMTDDNRNVLQITVTGYASWCSMYDPETKRQSATWLSPKKPKSQKMIIKKSRVKTLLTILFDT
jgi:hypothetical protein